MAESNKGRAASDDSRKSSRKRPKILTKSWPPAICEGREISTTPSPTISDKSKSVKKLKSGKKDFVTPDAPPRKVRKSSGNTNSSSFPSSTRQRSKKTHSSHSRKDVQREERVQKFEQICTWLQELRDASEKRYYQHRCWSRSSSHASPRCDRRPRSRSLDRIHSSRSSYAS